MFEYRWYPMRINFYGNISLLGFLLNISLLSVYYSNLYNYIKSQQAHLIYFTDIIFYYLASAFTCSNN